MFFTIYIFFLLSYLNEDYMKVIVTYKIYAPQLRPLRHTLLRTGKDDRAFGIQVQKTSTCHNIPRHTLSKVHITPPPFALLDENMHIIYFAYRPGKFNNFHHKKSLTLNISS